MISVGKRQAGIQVEGPDGIRATGHATGGVFTGRAGLRGKGYNLPGGTFETGQPEDLAPSAQVRLVPQPMWVPDQVPAQVVYEAPPPLVDQLPQEGNAGDLLVTIRPEKDTSRFVPPRAEATLWFCAVSSFVDLPSGILDPAIWRQVLLGPPILGKILNLGKG